MADISFPDMNLHFSDVPGVNMPRTGGGTAVFTEQGSLQTKTKTYTPTESQQTDAVRADNGYAGLEEVDVTVNAIDPTYVGSGITRRSSSDMTASGASVTAPAGYYENASTKSVATGTAGTPTATKGAVSNHAITVTPSVTNTTGYITGGTKTGTGVSVSAAEVTSGTKSITSNGTGIDVVNYAAVDVAVPSDAPNLQPLKSRTFTPSESYNTYEFGADAGYDGIDRVEISVEPISKTYVGSNVPRRSSSDMTVSGGSVTAPAGYYENASSKSVATGSAGTPTATKSAVSNHAVTVTPSVTNTTGYITGGTKTGTAVSVSASELVSGDVYINSAGPTDVTNVQTAYVSAGTEGTPTATKSAVVQHSITVTPSVTNEAGLISGGTKTGTPVTVSASELDSGTVYIDDDGDWDVVGVATASVPAGSVGTPTATKSAVSNHSVTVTPSVTHSAGWVGSGTKTGTGVSVSASELVSGSQTITTNDTYDVTNLETVTVNVSGGGGGSGFVDTVVTLPNGGDHHIITGVDLSHDTVSAPHLEVGYTAHDHEGNPVVGELVPGGGGGTSQPRKDVNFFDYDGTIVASYTAQEALALNALPSNPSHSGLTAQGWNYTLAEMKAEVNAVGKCDIGQMYITASGDTEIDVSFPSSARLSPILSFSVNGTVTVNWGDNTTADTVTGNSLTTRKDVPHTYTSAGNYTIVIHVVSGSFQFYSQNGQYPLLGKSGGNSSQSYVYSNSVKAIRIGSGVTSIGSNGFTYCYSLTSVTIPSGVTSIGSYAFNNCYSLASVTIPSEVTSIASYSFNYCYSLASVSIPSGVTSIGTYAFYYCLNLASVTIPNGVTSISEYVFYYCRSLAIVSIPSGVTSIGNNAFQNCPSIVSVKVPSGVTSIGTNTFNGCYGVGEYHLLPTTPPSISTSTFQTMQTDCIIYVPSASLSAYQTATNWSTYASQMQGE